jgi:hypothetical protein
MTSLGGPGDVQKSHRLFQHTHDSQQPNQVTLIRQLMSNSFLGFLLQEATVSFAGSLQKLVVASPAVVGINFTWRHERKPSTLRV